MLRGFFVVFCVVCLKSQSLPLDTLTLPPGFQIEIYANNENQNIISPRQLDIVEYEGSIITYVGTDDAKDRTVRALVDRDSDYQVDEVYELFTGKWLFTPSVAVSEKTGDMFTAEINMTYYCPGNVNEMVLNGNVPLTCYEWFYIFYDNSDSHNYHNMAFNSDDDICIAFGSNCNECILPMPYGTIQCFEDNNVLNGVLYAQGMRNSVGFDWHPLTNDMWFTENGRDEIGKNPTSPYNTNNCPDDELNWIPSSQKGLYYGYPYCHTVGSGDPFQRDPMIRYKVPDPDLGSGNTDNCTSNVTLAHQPLGPHVAALGMKFYTGDMFPSYYENGIFICEHGSWDRHPKIGYRVVFLQMSGESNILSHDIFIEGWLNNSTQQEWGRPAGIDMLPDGSLLISDDLASVIYRVYYNGTET